MSLTSPAATLELARVEFDIHQAISEIDALDNQLAVFKAIRRDWQRRLDAARGRLRALQAEPTNLLPDDDDAAFWELTAAPKVEGTHPRPASMTADSPEAWRRPQPSPDVAIHIDTPFVDPDAVDLGREIARIPNRSPVAIAFPTPDPDDECEGRVE